MLNQMVKYGFFSYDAEETESSFNEGNVKPEHRYLSAAGCVFYHFIGWRPRTYCLFAIKSMWGVTVSIMFE